jgi:hypothetical protein
MRKQIIQPSLQNSTAAAQTWLDLEKLAKVQVSSEDATKPIELALIPGKQLVDNNAPGWLAAQPGEQILRLLFDKPQNIQLIHLLFQETQQVRTQEFLLRYSTDKGKSYQDIVRQQYTFSPPDTSIQTEDYSVQLEGVTTLELKIIPDISGGMAHASLTELKLA